MLLMGVMNLLAAEGHKIVSLDPKKYKHLIRDITCLCKTDSGRIAKPFRSYFERISSGEKIERS